MNRTQRRRAKVQELAAVTITCRNLPPVVWSPGRAVDSSMTYVGPNDNAIFSQALGGLLGQMGVQDMSIAAAMLFRAINADCSPEMRLIIAMGIIQGLDYRIAQKEVVGKESETVLELTVEGFPAFEPITQKKPDAVPTLVDPDGRPLL